MNQIFTKPYLKDRHAFVLGEEPMIFHCHHYNTYLQAVIEDCKEYLDVYPILVDAAHEVAFTQLRQLFANQSYTEIQRIELAEALFSFAGFGKLALGSTHRGVGKVECAVEHYAQGWVAKFGKRNPTLPGVSFFACGFITGALEAIYHLPLGSLEGQQTYCVSKGDTHCEFSIKSSSSPRSLHESPGEGFFQQAQLGQPVGTQVNYVAIRDAVASMPLLGSEKEGLIEAFGVLLTRMYSNYYCLISYRFLKNFEREMGSFGLSTAIQLLTEAGHVCAFNTFGGIMQSVEWNALIKPMLSTKEDWVHGIVAVVNALGWGIWEVVELVPGKKLQVRITSGYEANSFLKQYYSSTYPVSFLATGGVAGIMNLIYNTSLCDEKLNLNNQFYRELHSHANFFVSKQLKCRAMGDDYDLFEAYLSK